MADLPTNSPTKPRNTLEGPGHNRDRPVVIGLYGVPGCGKSFLLKQLQASLSHEPFIFYEGSEAIAALVTGGLDAFHRMEEQEKAHWRQDAISSIGRTCVETATAAVVTGHFMFWPEEDDAGRPVYTARDLETYTHILYLDIPAELVVERRLGDRNRGRSCASVNHLRKWQEVERSELRRLCYSHGIIFLPVTSSPEMMPTYVSMLLRHFNEHNEANNNLIAEARMDDALAAAAPASGNLETVIVLDADRTLAAEDSGAMFWELGTKSGRLRGQTLDRPLYSVFSSPMGYSYTAFRQVVLLYEEAANNEDFELVCEAVASAVSIHPEIQTFLRHVSQREHVTALVMTCGLRRVWDMVLARYGLGETARVIGGGRIADGFVVTGGVKAALVRRLRDVYHLFVWALGDSVLDLAMFKEAHEAVVVVGEAQMRSETMDAALSAELDAGLRARQVLLPPTATPRLDMRRLPILELGVEFCESILRRRPRMLHASDQPGTRLLTTPTRDARVAGPVLRESHRQVGRYLAIEFVSGVVGVEEYEISHVQGHPTVGHRLYREEQTLIVALMRAGEPMALGVNDVFPLAALIHAKRPLDIQEHHLQGRHTVLLVDAVVNSGKSVVEIVRRLRLLDATIRIVLIAGVIQSQATSVGTLAQVIQTDANIFLTALRVSANKYTGTGGTDTGNRLFNTTHFA